MSLSTLADRPPLPWPKRSSDRLQIRSWLPVLGPTSGPGGQSVACEGSGEFPPPSASPVLRLSVRARQAMRLRHCSRRTEEAYLGWMRRYHGFHGRRDPAALGAEHVTPFLNKLASHRCVAASTHNQALAALHFLYREVLGINLAWLSDLVHAKTPMRLPVVLTRDEVRAILERMEGPARLMATLLSGCGLRLLECCHLRVEDVDFGRNQITVRRGEGDKDRATMLPLSVKTDLVAHLARVRAQHDRDLSSGAGWVELPDALAKNHTAAAREWPWQWVFPATRMCLEPESREKRRHHQHEAVVQRAVRQAILKSGIAKRATCHTFRHSFATHLLECQEALPCLTWVKSGEIAIPEIQRLFVREPTKVRTFHRWT